jgi:hypothetical protein
MFSTLKFVWVLPSFSFLDLRISADTLFLVNVDGYFSVFMVPLPSGHLIFGCQNCVRTGDFIEKPFKNGRGGEI